MIRLAKEMRDATRRGEDLGLNDDEIAFYDALAMNASAVQVMGIDELVRRILKKHGYGRSESRDRERPPCPPTLANYPKFSRKCGDRPPRS